MPTLHGTNNSIIHGSLVAVELAGCACCPVTNVNTCVAHATVGVHSVRGKLCVFGHQPQHSCGGAAMPALEAWRRRDKAAPQGSTPFAKRSLRISSSTPSFAPLSGHMYFHTGWPLCGVEQGHGIGNGTILQQPTIGGAHSGRCHQDVTRMVHESYVLIVVREEAAAKAAALSFVPYAVHHK